MDREVTVNKLIKQMDTLFITYRRQYLKQVKTESGSTFITMTGMVLAPWQIEEHLVHGNTIGVKLGKGGLTKFFTFDVDIMDETDRRLTTLSLVNKLRNYYGIPLKDIHVWYSGLKGYHVDLYFDNVISEKELEPFYYEVLHELRETPKRIERRPTTGMGVKLPLGVHLTTGNSCYYVDNQTLEPLSEDYFLNIVPQSLEEFKENILDGVEEKYSSITIKKIHTQTNNTEFQANGKGKEIQHNVINILNAGHLLKSNSRNDFTFNASRVLKNQGHTSEDAFDIIIKVLENTFNNVETRGYLDSKWTMSTLASETKRVVQLVYEKDYGMSLKAKEITFHQQEMDKIMNIKVRHLRKLLFSLVRVSKMYAKDNGEFFVTHEQLGEMGNDKNAGRSIKNIRELERMGFIEIVQSGHYISDNRCAPNYYKILIEEPSNVDAKTVTYNSDDELELYQVIKDLNPDIQTNVVYTFK